MSDEHAAGASRRCLLLCDSLRRAATHLELEAEAYETTAATLEDEDWHALMYVADRIRAASRALQLDATVLEAARRSARRG